MHICQQETVQEQYQNADKLKTRIQLHQKYSTNRQGFGNWITSQYRFPEEAEVLELGCGTGEMWIGKTDLFHTCSKLVLSDLSEGMLRQCQDTLGDIPPIQYRLIDVQHIPDENSSFDIVIANMMLYHVPDLSKALAEVKRVLKPDGIFYCATYGEHGMMEYLCGLFAEYGIQDHSNYIFTLQNGASRLSKYFSDVQRIDYVDSLEVTHIDDLVDYILSLSGMSALRSLPRSILVSVLEKHMRGGALHVPKEYGMFICR